MIYAALDPGTNIGWAVFDDEMILNLGTLRYGEEFFAWLDKRLGTIKQFIVEDYKIRPASMQKGWGHEWNDGVALQVIGAVKFFSYEHGLPPVVLQQPAIKPMAYKLMKREYKKGKANMHHWDAVAHGVYWWRKNGEDIKANSSLRDS